MNQNLYIKKYFAFIIIGLLCLYITGCGDSKINIVDDTLLDYKIGQMLFIGFNGLEIDEDHHIYHDIKNLNIGGVILYEFDVPSWSRPRNISSPEQVSQLVDSLQNISSDKLFIAIDQEGGRVNRLRENYGFPPQISAQKIGDTNDTEITRGWAAQTAITLSNLGININFAPVVDVNVNTGCPVIGAIERSFSEDPVEVFKHSNIFVQEHSKRNVITALKHFPGHGSSTVDSHIGFTDITHTWKDYELFPYFLHLFYDFNGMIMTAHTYHSGFDTEYPATLSYNTITNLLRNTMNWQGVVISDDMQMGAITDNYGLELAIEKSINAGVDILIFSNNSFAEYNPDIAEEAIEIIRNLVLTNKIPRQRINESYNRILKLKQNFLDKNV